MPIDSHKDRRSSVHKTHRQNLEHQSFARDDCDVKPEPTDSSESGDRGISTHRSDRIHIKRESRRCGYNGDGRSRRRLKEPVVMAGDNHIKKRRINSPMIMNENDIKSTLDGPLARPHMRGQERTQLTAHNLEQSGLLNRASTVMPKQRANFELSGKLTEDTNTYKGVVIKYNEPEDARKPTEHWRLYPFKGNERLRILHIHRQSGFLIGRDRKIADLPMDHPSISKQHAVFQYRLDNKQCTFWEPNAEHPQYMSDPSESRVPKVFVDRVSLPLNRTQTGGLLYSGSSCAIRLWQLSSNTGYQ